MVCKPLKNGSTFETGLNDLGNSRTIKSRSEPIQWMMGPFTADASSNKFIYQWKLVWHLWLHTKVNFGESFLSSWFWEVEYSRILKATRWLGNRWIRRTISIFPKCIIQSQSQWKTTRSYIQQIVESQSTELIRCWIPLCITLIRCFWDRQPNLKPQYSTNFRDEIMWWKHVISSGRIFRDGELLCRFSSKIKKTVNGPATFNGIILTNEKMPIFSSGSCAANQRNGGGHPIWWQGEFITGSNPWLGENDLARYKCSNFIHGQSQT